MILTPVFQIRASTVAKTESAAAVALLEELGDLRRIFAAKAHFLPHAFVPEFGQSFSRFDTEAVKEEIILIFVGLEKFLGHLGRAIADGDQLHAQHIKLAGFFGSEKVGYAQPPFGVLPGKAKPHPLARRAGGLQFPRAVLPAGAADKFFGVVHNQIIPIALRGEISIHHLGFKQLFRHRALLQFRENRPGFFIQHFLVRFVAETLFLEIPLAQKRALGLM